MQLTKIQLSKVDVCKIVQSLSQRLGSLQQYDLTAEVIIFPATIDDKNGFIKFIIKKD